MIFNPRIDGSYLLTVHVWLVHKVPLSGELASNVYGDSHKGGAFAYDRVHCTD